MSENKDKRDVNIKEKKLNGRRKKMNDGIEEKENIKSNVVNKNIKNNRTKFFLLKNKNTVLVSSLLIIDIILIICFARDNYANYADVEGNVIFVGEIKNLLFGRNYIGLIVTCFIYFYGVLVGKFLCNNKFKIKQLILLFIGIFVLNILLFYIFTNKIY